MSIHRIWGFIFRFTRRRRMQRFVEAFVVTDDTMILDVGGTSHNWNFIEQRPQVISLNLDQGDVIGDGCALPFRDQSFDIVFANSVIEHLGSAVNQGRFAREVQRVGRSYFVQTPNRMFPIEPHYLTPFIQFLPRRARVAFGRNFTVWGWLTRPTREDCEERCREIRLLTRREMAQLFPQVRSERLLGLPKALIAEHRGYPAPV